MRGIEPENQPIEKPPPSAGPFEEEPIHRRRQPRDTEPLAECCLAAHGLSVDPHYSALVRRAVSPGPDMQLAAVRREDGGNSPRHIARAASGLGPTIDLGQIGATQAATWREKGKGFQEIGLASAVRTREYYRLGSEAKPRLSIIAEVRQYEPRHADALRRGTGAAAGFLCLGEHEPVYGVKNAFLLGFGVGCRRAHTRIGIRT